MIVILLGEGCQITWDFDKLKIEKWRSVFEWFLSVKFTDLLYVIKKLSLGETLKVTHQNIYPGNLFLDDTDIRTTHYSESDLEQVLKRRGDRFIADVKSNEKILFVRYEHPEYSTTREDVFEFNRLIEEINPECQYKLLLFANPSKQTLLVDVDIPNFYHVPHNNSDINVLAAYIKEFEKIFN